MLGLGEPPAPIAQPPAEVVGAEERTQSLGERLHILRLREPARLEMTHSLRYAAHAEGDDGGAAGHALDRGVRQVVVAAREDEPLLARDYCRLFVGPNPLLAPPYESVHLGRERLMFEEPTFEVRAAYRAFGWQAPNYNREPDDHLGLEFSFLSLLCTAALDALQRLDHAVLEAALSLHEQFLRDHLLCWAPDCLSAVEANATTAFYRGVGALGIGVTSQAGYWLQ